VTLTKPGSFAVELETLVKRVKEMMLAIFTLTYSLPLGLHFKSSLNYGHVHKYLTALSIRPIAIRLFRCESSEIYRGKMERYLLELPEMRKTSHGYTQIFENRPGISVPFAPVLKVPNILVELKAPLGPDRITPEEFENAAYFCG